MRIHADHLVVSVGYAVRHPRDTAAYIFLGKKKFLERSGPGGDHTCFKRSDENLPLFHYMTANTDIHEHLVTLYMLTVEHDLKRVLELGTRDGDSTIALLHGAKSVEGHVTSVDLKDSAKARGEIRLLGLDAYWSFIKSDDLELSWDAPIDHLFIDTSHTFEHTVEELKKFEPFVKVGGVVTLHDSVTYPEVRRAVLEYTSGRRDLRVYEFLNNNGLLAVFKR
jgi:predicted O-methyltransferase YrrM